jgi:hypothetical protein
MEKRQAADQMEGRKRNKKCMSSLVLFVVQAIKKDQP